MTTSAVPTPVTTRRLLFPTLVGYQRSWLGRDVLAGLAAGAVVIPQAMGYATIANLPVQIGLFTCMVPMAVYAMLGGSRALSTSTTSTVATLSATSLVSAGVAASSANPVGALTTLTLLVGAILLAVRVLRLSSLVENINKATILGVQVGVGVTVAVGQLPKLLGETTNQTGSGVVVASNPLVQALRSIDPTTTLLSVVSLAIVVLLHRYAPRVPGSLLVLVGGIALSGAGLLPGVARIAPVPQGLLPTVSIPSLQDALALGPGAFAISLMVFVESIAAARSLRDSGEPRINPDRELLALSAANLSGAVTSTLPISGGFSQSAVNKESGARSQVAQLVTAGSAVVVALFLGPVLSLLPQAILAVLVFSAVFTLIRIGAIARLWRVSRSDFWVAAVTAVTGVAFGLLTAVAVGVGLTLLSVLRELNVPQVYQVAATDDALGLLIARGLYTANVEANLALVNTMIEARTPRPKVVVIDLQRIEATSITVLDAFADLDDDLAGEGIELRLAAVPAGAHKVADHVRWFQRMEAEGRVFPSVDSAMTGDRTAATADHSTDPPAP